MVIFNPSFNILPASTLELVLCINFYGYGPIKRVSSLYTKSTLQQILLAQISNIFLHFISSNLNDYYLK